MCIYFTLDMLPCPTSTGLDVSLLSELWVKRYPFSQIAKAPNISIRSKLLLYNILNTSIYKYRKMFVLFRINISTIVE